MLVAHRIRLDPNNVQASCLRARPALRASLSTGRWPSGGGSTTPGKPIPPWMLEVTKNAPQMAIRQPGRAFENFFARRAAYPTFRRKGRDDRFALSNDQFRIEDKRIRIPKLGWVRMREALRFAGRIVSAAISRVADRWYASITVDMPSLSLLQADNQGVVGIDLGTRQWTCPGCAASHDRDVNAAINLKNMAVSSIASACGGKGAGLARKCEAKPVPVNQESNGKVGDV